MTNVARFRVSSSLLLQLEELFSATFSRITGRDFSIEIAKTKDFKFGDYQCSAAMKIAKEMKISPIELAKQVIQEVGHSPLFQSLEVAGPGFINIRLSNTAIQHFFFTLFQNDEIRIAATERCRVIVDFSSPNVAKEMHVGHLRSTIIGDVLARLLEFTGQDVLRLNHVGDWGTSFGMLVAYIRSQPGFSLEKLGKFSLPELMQSYRAAKVLFDADPQFKKESQLAVVGFQTGQDKEAKKIWETICAISRSAYQQIYTLLDTPQIERGESFYNDMLEDVVKEFDEKKLITVSDGAKCCFLEGFTNREGQTLPLMLQKSDGGYTYDTTDVAALIQRIRQEKADWIIYVVDAGQSQHFDMVFAAVEKAGILDRSKVRVDHVPFGLVLGSDGKKYKTRSGDVEKLIDLLQEAIDRAHKLLEERNPLWSIEERQEVAKILGLGAVKYADLSCHRTSDYTFSYDRMLRFEGNTAAFIMYSYVRTESIRRKVAARRAQSDLSSYSLDQPPELPTEQDRALALLLSQFPEAVEKAIQELLPNRITEYLFSLAEQFNLFFRDCRVEGDPHESSRLILVAATGRVLRTGLSLLGISVPSKM